MLDFDFKERYIKEGKDIASVENSKCYWNERYCYISESRGDVQYLEKFASHYLAYKRFVETSLNKWMYFWLHESCSKSQTC